MPLGESLGRLGMVLEGPRGVLRRPWVLLGGGDLEWGQTHKVNQNTVVLRRFPEEALGFWGRP